MNKIIKYIEIILFTGLAVSIIVGSLLVWQEVNKQEESDTKQIKDKSSSISNYEECVAAGYPVMESYPEQCAVPDGKTYVNESRVIDGTLDDKQAEAIRQAEAYMPGEDMFCTQVLVEAIHTETGVEYTFPSGCLAPGWEPKQISE